MILFSTARLCLVLFNHASIKESSKEMKAVLIKLEQL